MVPFVTPMRLGIILENISIEVKESIKEIRGPRLGAPANAIDGFLKKNKIERSELQEKKTSKGIILFLHFKDKYSTLIKYFIADFY